MSSSYSGELAIDNERLEVAVDAAVGAAEIHEEHREELEGGKRKEGDGDVVTDADINSAELIRLQLSDQFPEDGVRGEENDSVESDSGFTWIIDPVDGTVNYVHGVLGHAVLIGGVKNGEVEIGVAYDTYHDDLYYAVSGEGAYKNDEPISVSDHELEDGLVEFEFHSGDIRDGFTQDYFEWLLENSHGVRTVKCIGITTCLVADGSFEVAMTFGTNPWDIAAGVCIVREAGGVVTDKEGNDSWDDIKEGKVIFSNQATSDEVRTACSRFLQKHRVRAD